MTRLPRPTKPSWRDVNWENALEGACVAGLFYVYAALKRVGNVGRTLLGVARTPLDVLRLVRRVRASSRKAATVEVYRVQQCRRAPLTVHKVASFPLRDL
jgi:hypothetical protein